jgi:NLI interacting factor-like phosphatase
MITGTLDLDGTGSSGTQPRNPSFRQILSKLKGIQHSNLIPMEGMVLFKQIRPSSSKTDKVIVLDLDETLVHTPRTEMSRYRELELNRLNELTPRIYVIQMRDAVDARGTGNITTMWGVIRPHAKEFLAFCFSYFKMVIVWSAGVYEYVHEISKLLFAELPQPHAILTRRDCTEVDGNYDKNLHKLYDNDELGKYATPKNTMIIDDRTVSYSTSCPDNGVHIPAYSPEPEIPNMKSDNIALLQLRAWLLRPEIRESDDVRTLDKRFFHRDLKELESKEPLFSDRRRRRRRMDLSDVSY